jgi:hypothetical protein
VLINATGSYKVTDSQNATIYTLGTNSGTTLEITNGNTLTTEAGTGSSSDAGTILVDGGATFSTLGMFTQSSTGLISASASGATVDLAEGTIKGGKMTICRRGDNGRDPGRVRSNRARRCDGPDTGTLEATNATVLTLANDSISGKARHGHDRARRDDHQYWRCSRCRERRRYDLHGRIFDEHAQRRDHRGWHDRQRR